MDNESKAEPIFKEAKKEDSKTFEKFLPLKKWRHFLFSDGVKFFENDFFNPDLSILNNLEDYQSDVNGYCKIGSSAAELMSGFFNFFILRRSRFCRQ